MHYWSSQGSNRSDNLGTRHEINFEFQSWKKAISHSNLYGSKAKSRAVSICRCDRKTGKCAWYFTGRKEGDPRELQCVGDPIQKNDKYDMSIVRSCSEKVNLLLNENCSKRCHRLGQYVYTSRKLCDSDELLHLSELPQLTRQIQAESTRTWWLWI